jgi:hypothetical protein
VIIEFSELKKFAIGRWPDDIETTLLGRVPWKIVDKVPVGVIPEWVEAGARKHGLVPLTADHTRNAYSFRLIAPPNPTNASTENERTEP